MAKEPSNFQVEPVEPIIKWLFVMVMTLVFVLIGVSKWSPNDGTTFQAISGVLTTFAGVLAGRITPSLGKKQDLPPGSVQATTTDTVTHVPPESNPPVIPPVV